MGFLLRSPYGVVVYQKHWALSRLRGEGSTRRHRHLPLWRNSSVAGLYPAGVSANLTGGSIGDGVLSQHRRTRAHQLSITLAQ